MSEQPEKTVPTLLEAALARLCGGTLAVFEYSLAVATITALILSLQPETRPISTLAAVLIATVVSRPLLVAIHLWVEWEKKPRKRSR
ncbi:MAG: hypothetical protein IR164_08060 [Devosia sp.]|jgi:hypothetical protein|uniref:hypothetical protein n=1 Tax=unclassified Devosia TaxID=196773 RepID=UPI0019F67C41|nr:MULTISPECIES: hypothetical protein [unclassified Devosia]MBF0678877.1 hypothetical protein [Devosia sp.]WEJ32757.1 hypothetical protein NYQ88_18035 [Devosia sp. SD17-2]